MRHLPDLENPFVFAETTRISKNTFRLYQRCLIYCSKWLTDNQRSDQLPLQVQDVSDWLQAMTLVGLKPNTIQQRFWAIGWLHAVCDFSESDNPVYAADLRRYKKRILRVRAANGISNKVSQKLPLRTADIQKLVRHCPKTLTGSRDKLILLLGFVSALRRSELAALEWQDITLSDDQQLAILMVKKSKSDQMAAGQSVTILASDRVKTCPVRALLAWQAISGLDKGPVFRQISRNRYGEKIGSKSIAGRTVANTVKRYCQMADLNPDDYAGHSLRRGMLISAIEKGGDLHGLRIHARHHDIKMTEHYVGTAQKRGHNPTKGII